jgi:hypothetical protein
MSSKRPVPPSPSTPSPAALALSASQAAAAESHNSDQLQTAPPPSVPAWPSRVPQHYKSLNKAFRYENTTTEMDNDFQLDNRAFGPSKSKFRAVLCNPQLMREQRVAQSVRTIKIILVFSLLTALGFFWFFFFFFFLLSQSRRFKCRLCRMCQCGCSKTTFR